MSKLGVVIAEVYRKNVKSIGFLVMVLSPLFMVAIFGAIGYFMGREVAGTQDAKVGLVTEIGDLGPALSSAIQEPLIIQTATVEEAKKQLAAGDLDGYLVVQDQAGQLSATYFSQPTDKNVNLEAIQGFLSQYSLGKVGQSLDLSQQELEQVQNASLSIAKQEIKFDENGKEVTEEDPEAQAFSRIIKQGTAYAISIFVFIFIMNYAGIIAQEVASEKGTRIMEIILSSMTATTHFFGKLIGIILVLLTQLGVYLVMGILAWRIPYVQDFMSRFLPDIPLGKLVGSVVLLGAVFFFFGVILYIAISAFLGSLVTKTEDIQKAMAPLSMLGLIGFYVGIFGLTSSNSLVVKIASYIPFWTPFVMPFRMASDTVSTTGLIVSVVILLVATPLITYLSILFYRSNVLIYSDGNMWQKMQRSLQILQSEAKTSKNKA